MCRSCWLPLKGLTPADVLELGVPLLSILEGLSSSMLLAIMSLFAPMLLINYSLIPSELSKD